MGGINILQGDLHFKTPLGVQATLSLERQSEGNAVGERACVVLSPSGRPPRPHNVTVFGDGAFKEVMELK